jgi:hypothetical protein
MTLGLAFGLWTGVIIFLHYNPNGGQYTGVNVPDLVSRRMDRQTTDDPSLVFFFSQAVEEGAG